MSKVVEALRAIIDTLDAEEMGEGPPAAGHVAHWQKLHDDGTAALAALDAETEVKIKPLEWSANWNVIKAESPIGHYFIAARRDGGFECRLEEHWNTWASSEAAAKAAAQVDFERRIRSALVTPEARS